MTADSRPSVLFVCVHNAGRSQMAAALLAKRAEDRIRILSAGSAPADEVSHVVREVMREIGITLDGERPKLLGPAVIEAADVVITMGCGDTCPIVSGKRYLNWQLDDPAGQPVAAVRRIRDEIGHLVAGLLAELLPPD